uniref:Phytanoyl-CoA hydroxylase-interacting protein-like C-terminal domain-containing protein n=1 Tax=Strongyloides stercoralis TaxID=6248 RepID=A0AAF5CPX1_STRER
MNIFIEKYKGMLNTNNIEDGIDFPSDCIIGKLNLTINDHQTITIHLKEIDKKIPEALKIIKITEEQFYAQKIVQSHLVYQQDEITFKVTPGFKYQYRLYVVDLCTKKKYVYQECYECILSKSKILSLYAISLELFAKIKCPPVRICELYRCKPKSYFEKIDICNKGIMYPYIKDNTGHAGNPLIGKVRGLFFSGKLNDRNNFPEGSSFGDKRFVINAYHLLNPDMHNYYFGDIYCTKSENIHVVTIVVCNKNTPEDIYCRKHLVFLCPKRNEFITCISKQGLYEYYWNYREKNNVSITLELFYCGPVDTNIGYFEDILRVIGDGSTTPGGIGHKKNFITCCFIKKIRLISNLSKVCLNFSKATNFANDKGTIYFLNEYVTNCTIDSKLIETEISLESNSFYKSYDLINIEEYFLEIFIINDPPQSYGCKEFGTMINKNLIQLPYQLINEIQSDNISEIVILIDKDFSCQKCLPMPDLKNCKIFDGFKNLKTIKLYVENLMLTEGDKTLIDIVSNIKEITIDVILDKLQSNINFPIHSSATDNCIFSYIISKKCYLSIFIPYFINNFNLIRWLKKLNTFDYTFICSLSFNISLPSEIQEFSKYLSLMTNLKWLRLVFKINYKCLKLEKYQCTTSKEYLFESSKHLQKLKTIQIIWYFNMSTSVIKKFMEGQNKENNEAIQHKINKCLKIWEKETFSFFTSVSKSIKNLYFYAIPQFNSKITSFLNDLFPNLNFLFLGSIPNIEKKCLKILRNLKIFVSRNNEVLELPTNIKSCMISDAKYLLKNNIRKEKYEKCFEHYKKLKCFKKEYDVEGLIIGKIFFNNFDELYDIKVHFNDIKKIHLWYDKHEKAL